MSVSNHPFASQLAFDFYCFDLRIDTLIDNRMAHKVTSQGLNCAQHTTIELLLLANKSDINERSMAIDWACNIETIGIVFAVLEFETKIVLIANYELDKYFLLSGIVTFIFIATICMCCLFCCSNLALKL